MNIELSKFLASLPVEHQLSQVLIKADSLGSVFIERFDRSHISYIKICICNQEQIWAVDMIHMDDSVLVKLAERIDNFIKDCIIPTVPIGDPLNHTINSKCIDLGPIKPPHIAISPYASGYPVDTEEIPIATVVKFYNDIKKEFESRGYFTIDIPKFVDVLFKLGIMKSKEE